jgi:hypothetical protein
MDNDVSDVGSASLIEQDQGPAERQTGPAVPSQRHFDIKQYQSGCKIVLFKSPLPSPAPNRSA